MSTRHSEALALILDWIDSAPSGRRTGHELGNLLRKHTWIRPIVGRLRQFCKTCPELEFVINAGSGVIQRSDVDISEEEEEDYGEEQDELEQYEEEEEEEEEVDDGDSQYEETHFRAEALLLDWIDSASYKYRRGGELGNLFKTHTWVKRFVGYGNLAQFCRNCPSLNFTNTGDGIIQRTVNYSSKPDVNFSGFVCPDSLQLVVQTTKKATPLSTSNSATPPLDLLSQVLKAESVRILSLGSGDGSMPASIVLQGHFNIVPTFYDSREVVLRKYPRARDHLVFLESILGHEQVLFSIDATALDPKIGRFDLVLFYFPHTGVPNASKANATSNRTMLRGFLESVPASLKEDGEVHIALKTGQPYDSWDIHGLIRESMLKVKFSHLLNRAFLPGYKHVATKGGDICVADDDALVYVLVHKVMPLADEQISDPDRKRNAANCLDNPQKRQKISGSEETGQDSSGADFTEFNVGDTLVSTKRVENSRLEMILRRWQARQAASDFYSLQSVFELSPLVYNGEVYGL